MARRPAGARKTHARYARSSPARQVGQIPHPATLRLEEHNVPDESAAAISQLE
jgi:hypothetical protein